MTLEVWRPFAWRTAFLWVALHAAMVMLRAVASSLGLLPPDVDPLATGWGSGAWTIGMLAVLLALDITRARERLLLHDLGIRLRVLIPLAIAPAAFLELALVLVVRNAR